MKKPHTQAPAARLEPAFSPGLRRYLYFTAFACGAAVLIVEILGAKMLSPYFGTSHFVWTAQIAVTLISLAAGYWFGGWFVDRSPKLTRLYFCILIAGAYLCFSVLCCRTVAEKCLDFKLAIGSLLTSLFLFFVPLALLATVGPFLIRVMTASLNVVGGQVGRVTGLSTLGSVIGTILIGYALIPFFPNSATMCGTAVLLMLVAVGYFGIWRKAHGEMKPAAVVVLAGLVFGYWGIRDYGRIELSGVVELARQNSNFGQMVVLQSKDEPRRFYFNDFLCQNGYDPVTKQSVHGFTYMLHGLARAYTEKINDALCIGLGVGIVPMQFAREGAKVDVVEINPAVVPLAKEYFDFDPNRVNVTIDDGRHYLNRCRKKYDTVILDAFLGDSSPSYLMTREAFSAMRSVLRPGGTLVINTFGNLEFGHDYYTASLKKTLRVVFKSVKIHTADPTGNIFFVASDRPELTFLHKPAQTNVFPGVAREVQTAFEEVVQTDLADGRVLTDDFNPIEFYDAANRERIRRLLASSMTGGSDR